MIINKQVAGIGCIEQIMECSVCNEELLIGSYDRMDGSGHYHECDNDEEQFDFLDLHSNCGVEL